MKLLVDTHVLIWGFSAPSRLPDLVRRMISSVDHETYVSAVCLWEIAIKLRTGRLQAPDNLPDLIANNPDYRVLPVEADHAWKVRELPRLHGDPFDQLLIAQALVEEMTVVTHDRMIGRYGVPIIAV